MIKTLFVLMLLLFSSCVSTKYNGKRSDANFSQLQAGKTYVFFYKNDLKTKMEITSIEKDSIIGLQHQNRIAIAKNSIMKVKKNNTAGTVILIGTSVGFIAITYVIFKAILDIGRGFGFSSEGE